MTKKISRFIKMSVTTTGVAGRHLSGKLAGVLRSKEIKEQKLKESWEKSGETIAETMASLKGPLMKLGQMASIQSGFLPAEFAVPMARLRQNAIPEPFSVIQCQIEAELKAPLETLYREMDEQPYAAASIGQVHRAVTHDGLEVAVKVQYPGMRDLVEADVSSLSLALKALGVASRQNSALKQVASEFKQNLLNELDYDREAINQQQLKRFHQAHHPFVIIPNVVSNLSSKCVLTTTFCTGDSLEQAALYSQDIRNRIGEQLLTMLYQQIFGCGILHGDPNPANYGFTPNGDIILYDFGCVKKFDKPELQSILCILKGFLETDKAAITEGLKGIGALPENSTPLDDEFFELVNELLVSPLNPHHPFDVAQSNMHLWVMSHMHQFRKYRKQFVIPAQLLLLQRVNVGCYGNLRKLKAKIRVRKILEEVLQMTPKPDCDFKYILPNEK